VLAPMAGSLIAWKVADGDSVQAGQVIAVMESMKMETSIVAETSGTLRTLAQAGAMLQAGQVVGAVH
ncbi:MAG: acetyl-CoA carboxylase biotin carboxyl carrier protein subunit, partial [Comamonas sp.]|nr:acetyl-CoA carboxylase biotin carboxyl carrier protein subunit [Candidatus Comamonas equi]